MTKTQIVQLILLLILALCAAFVFFGNKIRPSAPPQEAQELLPQNSPTSLNQAASQKIGASAAETDRPEPGALVTRDPFQLPPLLQETLRQKEAARVAAQLARTSQSPLPASAPPRPPPLTLQGILWGTPRPRAIVNRKILSVGDTIEGAQITAITPEGVTISFAGQEYPLKLPTKSSTDNRTLSGREGVQKW